MWWRGTSVIVVMAALAQQAGAHPERPPAELPSVDVDAPKRNFKPKPQVRREAQRRKPGMARPAANVAAAAAAAPSGAPNAGSGAARAQGMASEVVISGEEINARPATRPGEVLEAVPGLIVTQHSGEGKANQYFLRGYNLDHGTDLALHVDDVPANMRTHAHGQGYADLNWLMPETIGRVDVRKGPYFADEGDFASAGSVHIGLIDSVPKAIAQVTAGSFGYRRFFGMDSVHVGDGHLLIAGEAGRYDGPWTTPDDAKKLNGLMRYSQGTATDGFSITGMAYANRWTSTDQVPERAITSGLLGRYDSVDPTDGGKTNRFALSGRIAGTDEAGAWKANAYVVKSQLDLYNNFTYALSNPTYGDQFHQHDDRLMLGANASRTLSGSFAGLPMETTFGVQTRYDAIALALSNTRQRVLLTDIDSSPGIIGVVRADKVGEGSVGLYVENTVRWTDWLRTTVGYRGDYYQTHVYSLTNGNNTGDASASLGSPKFRMVIGPFEKTEFFLGAGYGMHSNDARGATTTDDPNAPGNRIDSSPLLVRTKGAEVGVRTRIIPGLDSSLSVFMLNQDSEILFSGDAGDTEASRPSRRYGFELTNHYRPASWIDIDADLAMTHARFVGYDSAQAAVYDSLAGYPQAQLGNAPGNSIPNAPAMIASAGITLGDKTGWFGGVRWRYLGSTPLTEDNYFRSTATSVFNGRIGFRDANGWRIQLDVLNLLNTKANQISYGYGSLLSTDQLYRACYPGVGTSTVPAQVCQTGVMDRVLHPIEPLTFRVTVAGTF
ncbi:TonB-dependent receptor [Bradyrhizobium sp. SSBR45G]|uniref:TonB-dependent receptor n=1 Tax=unclassified Bradyrhizobium TaxID=2631580 RepID=UPI002342B7B4|nr:MULTISPECIES: TonB-dependent receptor [unclassified Bradyrhizobium]GLH78153.1 TonB-dependent receptor [Bradyrhizobium sp. SSBR45G]GLH86080.1 TonB-dependent receptor [Bradyrhizobium sp. SSBR45R]